MKAEGLIDTLIAALSPVKDLWFSMATAEKLQKNDRAENYCRGVAEGIGLTLTALEEIKAHIAAGPPTDPHPMSKDYMNEAARAVEAKLPDNNGFLLLVSPFGEGDHRLLYISTMQRADALNLLKEFLIKAGAAEDWMKHIK